MSFLPFDLRSYNLGWPQTCNVAEASLDLLNFLALPLRSWDGLQMCTTKPGLKLTLSAILLQQWHIPHDKLPEDMLPSSSPETEEETLLAKFVYFEENERGMPSPCRHD